MKLYKLQVNSKVLRKYLLSFILVFIIPSIFMVLFFNQYTANVIGKKAESELKSKFLRNYEEVDKRFKGVANSTLRLSVDTETLSIANAKDIDSDVLIRMSQYIKKITELCLFDNYIKSTAVYFNNNDIVLTERGKFGYYTYAALLKKNNMQDPEHLKSLLPKKNYINLLPAEFPDNANLKNDVQNLTILHSFPINRITASGTIIMSVDRSILFVNDSNNEIKTDENMLILDKNGDVLVSRRDKSLTKDEIQSLLVKEPGQLVNMKVAGINTMVLYEKSTTNNWWYVFSLPQAQMTSNIDDFKELLLVVVILYVTGGLLISLFLTIFNYNPIRIIMNEIQSMEAQKELTGKESRKSSNEYDIIKKYINDLYNERSSLNTKITTYLDGVKNNFFRELAIEGVGKEYFEKMCETLNLKFENERNCCLIISLGKSENISVDDVNKSFFTLGLLTDLTTKFGTGYEFAIQKDFIGFIINLNSDVELESLAETYSEAADYIGKNNNRQIVVGIGSITDGFENIHTSYNEANQAVKYGLFYKCKVFTCKNVSEAEQNKYNCTQATVDKFVNCMGSGDFDSSGQLLAEVYENNFTDGKVSLNSAYALYYNLMSAIKKVIERNSIDTSDLPPEFFSFFVDNKYTCVDEIHEILKKSCNIVCGSIIANRDKSMKEMSLNIITYISSNFNDTNISCKYVADKFSISQPHLSNIVKKHSGMGFSDYVNNLRINEAKKLLRDSDYNVNEIAERTGYSSSNSFIRTFKNYEGVTPGQFKNLNTDASLS